MSINDRQLHWEQVYHTKSSESVSWYQPSPLTSLEFVRLYELPLTAKIIDIGGGDSMLVDALLDLGYVDITVLDISATAIDKAKKRLGERADFVTWIVSDILTFQPEVQYDFWHDRATFHFLTDDKEIDTYLALLNRALKPGGRLLLGTFSEEGPDQCSGLPIRKYSESKMQERLQAFFEKIKCVTVDHITPAAKIQSFIFCGFRKN
jgi:SAM-dependent methyltransferase